MNPAGAVPDTRAVAAAATDDIADALNYKSVAKRLIQFVGDSQFQLVETLAEKICEIVLKEFDVPWVRLTLHKPGAVSGSRSVGVMIERGGTLLRYSRSARCFWAGDRPSKLPRSSGMSFTSWAGA